MLVFFFFQAEDGIRDIGVTGVQTCALPISGGQRQSVAVAKAVMWNSKLVILDEPTAALGVAQTRQVLDLVKRLGEQGLAVVLISRSEEHTSELQSRQYLVCRLLLEKKKNSP